MAALSGWGAFFSAIAGPIAKKVLAALGMGMITFAGFQAIKGQIDSAVSTMWAGMPASVYQVVALAGFVDAVGVWLGALTTAVTLLTIKRLGVLQQ